MTRTMESVREWKDQKLYTAMEIRHLVVPSLSSSRSLAETRATLEGEKCGHPGVFNSCSFLLTFATPWMFRDPPYIADVVTTIRRYFFISRVKTRWPHGNAMKGGCHEKNNYLSTSVIAERPFVTILSDIALSSLSLLLLLLVATVCH